MGISGGCAYLLVRPELFVATAPFETLARLTEQANLARIGVALELATVVFQALTAVWFARLFRHVDMVAAMAVALFGIVNAVATMASAVMLRAALDATLGPVGADASISHLLVLISNRFWDAGALFFGLWLLPMGWLVLKSRIGPRVLGWILLLGGVGYVTSVFIAVLAPDTGAWVAALPLLATVGEVWIIGLLLWRGFGGSELPGDAAQPR